MEESNGLLAMGYCLPAEQPAPAHTFPFMRKKPFESAVLARKTSTITASSANRRSVITGLPDREVSLARYHLRGAAALSRSLWPMRARSRIRKSRRRRHRGSSRISSSRRPAQSAIDRRNVNEIYDYMSLLGPGRRAHAEGRSPVARQSARQSPTGARLADEMRSRSWGRCRGRKGEFKSSSRTGQARLRRSGWKGRFYDPVPRPPRRHNPTSPSCRPPDRRRTTAAG